MRGAAIRFPKDMPAKQPFKQNEFSYTSDIE
jgi:hypothetical protein